LVDLSVLMQIARLSWISSLLECRRLQRVAPDDGC
jgi:hypothetical protein